MFLVYQYLHSKKDEDFQETVQRASEAEGELIHCAQQVLREVREKTSIGDPLLERLSVVLDGGVGLHGGACGALAASVMDLNLLFGSNLRDISYFGATKAFFKGLKNLRVDETEDITEPYGAARGVIEKFKEVTGSLECAAITDRTFSDYKSFQDHISSSKKCEDLINLCITATVQTIQKHTD